MATNNAINLSQQGTAYYNGTGTFTGVDGITAGYIYTSNGTNVAPSFQAGGSFNPSTMISLYDDFIFGGSGSGLGFPSQLPWFASAGWSTSSAFCTSANPGVIGVPGAADYIHSAGSSTPTGEIKLGGGVINVNWIIKIATLSTVTNRFTVRCGLGAGSMVNEPTSGVYFEYSDNINSGNWVGKTANASSRTSANSAVAASTSGFVNLGIIVNAAATSIAYYINGTQIANSPLAANIPTAAIVPFFQCILSVGTSANSVLIDAFYMTQTFTTPR